jgi:Family of unknown function (DUF5682)
MSQFHVLGIRHHGPASARNVLDYLHAIQPDCVLIELPEQCSPRLQDLAKQGFEPPVALLLYNEKDLQEAAFYPFAAYSPEWQAIIWAVQQHVEVRAIDLPFLFSPTANSSSVQYSLAPVTDAETPDAVVMRDPFLAIAQLDGFSDCERWWETRIERQKAEVQATFQTISELMAALRDAKTTPESSETLLREAHMRQGMRQAEKDGFQRIVVVCGAWHVPALEPIKTFKATTDAAVLKGKRKVKVETTWIPWSFEHLSIQRGYMAGVRTPAWYQSLYTYGAGHATSHWMSEAGRLLRDGDLPISSAHIIEAIRLADTLAILRNTSVPGIDELHEAAVSVLCGGSEQVFAPVLKQLIIGDVIGVVPAGLNLSPLKADFDARIRSAYLKLTSTATLLALDVRVPAHVKKSVLLHQLLLLNVHWGRPLTAQSDRRKGGFHEDWSLQWQPEFELRWIEMSAYGATILLASENRAVAAIQEAKSLTALVQLLGTVLKADLTQLLPLLSGQLKALSINTKDTFVLAEVALPLAEIGRYGSARKLDFSLLQPVLDDILTRLCVQIPAACFGLDEENDAEAAKSILSINRAVHFAGQEAHKAPWSNALEALAKHPDTSPMCQGLAYRLIFDAGGMDVRQIANALASVVSAGQEPYTAALWLDGFLQGNALLIIHHPPFFEVLHDWVERIAEEHFERSLPVLRRAFSAFSEPERNQIIRLVLVHREPKLTIPDAVELVPNAAQTEEIREGFGWLFGD